MSSLNFVMVQAIGSRSAFILAIYKTQLRQSAKFRSQQKQLTLITHNISVNQTAATAYVRCSYCNYTKRLGRLNSETSENLQLFDFYTTESM